MKITRANVEDYALSKGLEPTQIDGFPEGFTWKESGIKIGETITKGRIIKFEPLAEWEDKNAITYE